MAENDSLSSVFNGCSKQRGEGALRSDIEFELWKRCYYPNIREQLIGKVSIQRQCTHRGANHSKKCVRDF